MNEFISVTQLRGSLPAVVKRVGKGTRFTVIYRSRTAFQIVPVTDAEPPSSALGDDPLYRAKPVGRSADGSAATDHDTLLYGK
jgi:antitoxin (DNA-binding transcriptional repressor) of toxin-antitoxin stability system